MITDEMVAKALAASNKIRRHTDLSGALRMRAALEVVEADIRDAALEEARKAAMAERRGREGYKNDYERGAMAMSHTIEDAICALKTADASARTSA